MFLVSCKEDRFGWWDWLDSHKLDFINFIESHSGIKEAFFEERVDEDNESYWRIKPDFQYQLIFSCDQDDRGNLLAGGGYDYATVFLRETQLVIDEAPLFKFGSDGLNHLEIALNQNHPLYAILDKQWPSGLHVEINQWFPEQVSEETIATEHWLTISGTGKQDEFSVHPIHWPTFANGDEVNQHSLEAETNVSRSPFQLFQFLEWLMVMPGRSAARAASIHNIPPIRPIPEKNVPIVFSGYGKSHFAKSTNELDAWGILAGYIRGSELGGDPEVGETELGELDLLPANPLTFVNHILNSPDFLDTGYAVTGDVKLSFDMSADEFNGLIELGEDERHERLSELQTKVHPYLIYQPEGFKVEIEDVGVGISQVIPVLVGCWQVSHGIGGEMADEYRQVVHIQQPELHLHPKLQAQMGDVFLKSLQESGSHGRAFFLLESHSEHLLLRILRRIREHYPAAKLYASNENLDDWFDRIRTNALDLVQDVRFLKTLSKDQMNELDKRLKESKTAGTFSIPDFCFCQEDQETRKAIAAISKFGNYFVAADKISVVYVKKDADGLTKMSHLRLAEDGEFIDRWPDGFFADRDRELFGDEEPFA